MVMCWASCISSHAQSRLCQWTSNTKWLNVLHVYTRKISTTVLPWRKWLMTGLFLKWRWPSGKCCHGRRSLPHEGFHSHLSSCTHIVMVLEPFFARVHTHADLVAIERQAIWGLVNEYSNAYLRNRNLTRSIWSIITFTCPSSHQR